jgi:hypothetical protein
LTGARSPFALSLWRVRFGSSAARDRRFSALLWPALLACSSGLLFWLALLALAYAPVPVGFRSSTGTARARVRVARPAQSWLSTATDVTRSALATARGQRLPTHFVSRSVLRTTSSCWAHFCFSSCPRIGPFKCWRQSSVRTCARCACSRLRSDSFPTSKRERAQLDHPRVTSRAPSRRSWWTHACSVSCSWAALIRGTARSCSSLSVALVRDLVVGALGAHPELAVGGGHAAIYRQFVSSFERA